MRCVQVRDHGERYRDGDLSIAMRTAIDAHCATCEKCRIEYEGIKAMRVMFTETTVSAAPEEIFDDIRETVHIRIDQRTRQREKKFYLPNWWIMAPPGVRVAYALVIIILTAGGMYMGHDLWSNILPTNVATVDNEDYSGMNAFEIMQPGSVEQTYFILTSDGTESGGR